MVKKLCPALLVLTIIAATMFAACIGPSAPPAPVGGPCTYKDIPGTATIVSVEAAPSNEYNCANAVQVTFDFTPTDPAAVNSYRLPTWKDTGNHFTVGGGMNPPKNWVQAQGLTVGSKHACVRSEITGGRARL